MSRHVSGTSGYKGVYWRAERGKWVANLKVDGHARYLGSFTSERAAALAYDAAAVGQFGPFAATNLRLGLLAEVET